jgi:hypothetical protein
MRGFQAINLHSADLAKTLFSNKGISMLVNAKLGFGQLLLPRVAVGGPAKVTETTNIKWNDMTLMFIQVSNCLHRP